jgi:hypothetical protein
MNLLTNLYLHCILFFCSGLLFNWSLVRHLKKMLAKREAELSQAQADIEFLDDLTLDCYMQLCDDPTQKKRYWADHERRLKRHPDCSWSRDRRGQS